MAQTEVAPIHALVENLEAVVAEINQAVDRVASYVGGDLPCPCEEPVASGANLQSRLLRSIQTSHLTLSTINTLEGQLNYEGAVPAAGRGMAGPEVARLG